MRRGLSRGEWVPPNPLLLRSDSSRGRPGDFNYAGDSAIWYVSRRFIDALVDQGCTGWATYPIELFYEGGSPIEGEYAGLVITGRCGPVDLLKGAVVPGEPDIRRGIVIPEESWDGSDLLLAANLGGRLLLTDKARRALMDSPTRGLKFEPVSEARVFLPPSFQ